MRDYEPDNPYEYKIHRGVKNDVLWIEVRVPKAEDVIRNHMRMTKFEVETLLNDQD